MPEQFTHRAICHLRTRGQVIRDHSVSQVLSSNPLGDTAERDLLVYLPPGYERSRGLRYPVVFALASLSELHLAVPEAVSVIGHDNIPMAELSIPALTTTGLESPDSAERLIASVLSVCQGAVLEIGPMRPKVIVRASA
jgi:hypothetical protein